MHSVKAKQNFSGRSVFCEDFTKYGQFLFFFSNFVLLVRLLF